MFHFMYLTALAKTPDKSINTKELKTISSTIPSEYSIHKYTLGAESFSYIYKEPYLMQMKGVFYGINGAYSFYLGYDYFMKLDGRFAYGKTNYFSNNTGGFATKTPNKLFETRVLLNRNIQICDKISLIPFAGVGYRYKQDNSQGIKTSTGHNGYLRKSNYYYLPVGVSMNYNLPHGWNVNTTVEYDFLLEGKQKDYRLQSKILKLNQSKGRGLRSEILLEKTFSRYILSIGPYINYWNIKDSDRSFFICKCGANHKGYFYEPKNITKETGVKIKYTF